MVRMKLLITGILVVATAGALLLQAVDERAVAGCDTDTDCLEKFCMKPGDTCDGGPEPRP
jgi:hypothetical protein